MLDIEGHFQGFLYHALNSSIIDIIQFYYDIDIQ